MLGNDSSRQSTYANVLQNNGVLDFTEGCMPAMTQSLWLWVMTLVSNMLLWIFMFCDLQEEID